MVEVWLNTSFTKLREAKSISEGVICICKCNIELLERDLIFFRQYNFAAINIKVDLSIIFLGTCSLVHCNINMFECV